MPVTFYNSVSEFKAALPSRPHRGSDADFAGGMSYQDAQDAVFEGHEESLRLSDKLLEQIEAEGLALDQTHWQTERVGYVPCVPSYLAGDPECMFAPVEEKSETAPMRVFTCLSVSGSLEPEQVNTRGAAIMALCRKLNAIRPVELHVFSWHQVTQCKTKLGVAVIRLDTSPLDLTTASFVLGHCAMPRQLTMSWANQWNYMGSFGNGGIEKMRKVLGATEHDLVIDKAEISDDLVREPVKWVNAQIEKYARKLES